MKLTETCRCGASLTVETDGDTAAAYIDTHVTRWATTHRCLTGKDDQRAGLGFAATQTTPDLPHVWGHRYQEVRA